MKTPRLERSALLLGAFLGVALSFMLLQQSTPPASAHYAWPFYDGKWTNDSTIQAGNLQYWLDGTGTYRAKTQSDIVAARGQWNTVSGADWDFGAFTGFNNNIVWTGMPCTTAAYLQTVIVTFDPESGSPADSGLCGGQNNGGISRAAIRLQDRPDWKKGGGNVAPNKLDLRGAIVHELGHATGFGAWAKPDHFDINDVTTCLGGPTASTWSTMCPGTTFGQTNMRTTETHDEHTFKNAYPS